MSETPTTYAAALAATRSKDGAVQVRLLAVVVADARSADEARGAAYRRADEEWPSMDGWSHFVSLAAFASPSVTHTPD